MYQQLMIIGNVGQDPELAYTPQGVAVTKFSVAVNKVTGKGETRKQKTTWFRVTAWRERAEVVSQYLRKGAKVMVIGEVDVNAYIDKNKEPAASLELTAYEIKFLERADDDGGHQEPASSRRSNSSVEDPNDIPF